MPSLHQLPLPLETHSGGSDRDALIVNLQELALLEPPPIIHLKTIATASDSCLHSDIDEHPFDDDSGPGHFSSDRSFLSDSFDSREDASQIRYAIWSALSWLYSSRLDPTSFGLTQTIINAITYLPTYYAATLRIADSLYIERTVVDWSLVPMVDDSGYYPAQLPLVIPRQVRFILTLHDYYPSLSNILSSRLQEEPRPRFDHARNFPPIIIYMPPDEIPIRELDDPPDVESEPGRVDYLDDTFAFE
jgi:hypothetical protein